MADTWRYVQAVNWATLREFTVTEDHLKLLRHTHLYWDYGEGYGAPAINPKRPCGDSYVERSIAEILDALTATGNGTRRGITSISPPRPGSTSPVCTWRR
jgi:hypothetical protein